MICHAKRIADQERTNKRIEEMERESAPLFYTVVCLITLIACMGITEYHDTKKDAAQVSALLAQCDNGKSISFDGKFMECKLTPMVAGL